MTTPRLRPMSDTDRPAEIVVFFKASYQLVELITENGDYKCDPSDYGWCTPEEAEAIFADLLERIKPPDPNPVYWGDEVVSTKTGRLYTYIGPAVNNQGRIWCETHKGLVGIVPGKDLTYNGEPITEFCYGKRPEEVQ